MSSGIYKILAQAEGWQYDEGLPGFYRNVPGASPFAPYQYHYSRSGDWRELCETEGVPGIDQRRLPTHPRRSKCSGWPSSPGRRPFYWLRPAAVLSPLSKRKRGSQTMATDAKTQAQVGQAMEQAKKSLADMRAALENVGDALRAAALMAGEQTRQSLMFRSRVATITSLDLHELIEAGVIGEYGGGPIGQHATEWDALKADPLRWMLRLDDRRLEALWALIEKRQGRSAAPPAPEAHGRSGLDRWSIDHSAGRPILMLDGCSVIEAEDAEYLLRLIKADQPPQQRERGE